MNYDGVQSAGQLPECGTESTEAGRTFTPFSAQLEQRCDAAFPQTTQQFVAPTSSMTAIVRVLMWWERSREMWSLA